MLHWQPTFCDFNIPPSKLFWKIYHRRLYQTFYTLSFFFLVLPETKEPEVQKSDSTTVSHASQDEETNGLIEAPIVNDTSTSSPTTQIPEIPDSYTAITKSTTETSNLEKRPEQVSFSFNCFFTFVPLIYSILFPVDYRLKKLNKCLQLASPNQMRVLRIQLIRRLFFCDLMKDTAVLINWWISFQRAIEN